MCASEFDLKQLDGTRHYAVFIALTNTGFSAHVPDLPGCIATGRTRQQTLDRMTKAIEMHLHALREDGDPIPEPSEVEMLSVAWQKCHHQE